MSLRLRSRPFFFIGLDRATFFFWSMTAPLLCEENQPKMVCKTKPNELQQLKGLKEE